MVEFDITEGVPLSIGGLTNPKSARYKVSRDGYDVAIGDIPFLLYESPEHPYERQTAPFRKDQFDAERSVGEQSLTGWWLRSQSNFSGGMGIKFYEPLLGEGSETRYIESRGLNVFDFDDVRLLNKMEVATSGGADLELVGLGEGTALYRTGSSFYVLDDQGDTLAVSPGGTNPYGISRVPGLNWLIGHDTGIRRMNSQGGAQDAVTGASDHLIPFWVKDRIVATQQNKLYQLTLTHGAIDEVADLLFEHPNTNWDWPAIAETGSAVWMAGDGGGTATIYVTSVDNSAEAGPTLTTPAAAIQLPDGERVTAMTAYLDYLLICTTQGFRVAVTDGTQAQLGPLLWRDESAYSVDARGDYAWVGLGNGLTRRVALGITVSSNELDFAYANDVEVAEGGNVMGIGYVNDVLLLAVADVGATYLGDELVESGYLRTGFARFGTLEPKYFEAVAVEADVSAGGIAIGAALREGNYTPVTTVGGFVGSREFSLVLPGGSPPWQKLSLEFTLQRGSPTSGPQLDGYQLRALPSPQKRQRLISVPLLCFDRERSSYGTEKPGGEGWAFARIQDLEALEDSGVPVIVQDFRTKEARSVVVDQVHFVDAAPKDGEWSGFGGVLMATLRTVS